MYIYISALCALNLKTFFIAVDLHSYQYVTSRSIQNAFSLYIILNIIMLFGTTYFWSTCTFSPAVLNIWRHGWKAQGIISGWLVLINSTICKSSTKPYVTSSPAHLQPWPTKWVLFTSSNGSQKDAPWYWPYAPAPPSLASATFDGREGNYFRERRSTNGKCCCQVDLYYSWSITIWAATHVRSWRMWTWSTAALWLNSPEGWRERLLSSRTQNGFQAGHRVYHASWWRGGNIDHILRIRSVT